MPITYAGIPLLLEDVTGKVADHANWYLRTADMRCFAQPQSTFRNDLPLPYPNFSSPPPPKINTLYWPTGASRWAFGYFLADTEALDAIERAIGDLGEPGRLAMWSEGEKAVPDSTINGPNPFVVSQAELFLNIADNEDNELSKVAKEAAISPKMWLLPPRPLADSGLNDLWILPLVDERFHWQLTNLLPVSTTWATLRDEIKTALGLTDAVADTTTFTDFGFPDAESFSKRPSTSGPWFPATVLFDAMAECVGRRVNTLPRDSDLSVSLDDYTEAQELYDAFSGASVKAAGADFSTRRTHGAVPETVKFVFPTARDTVLGTDDDIYTKTENWKTTLGIEPTSGLVHTVNVAAAADYTTEGGAPDNAAAIATMTGELCDAYYGWLSRRYDQTFQGIIPWVPQGFDDWVEWSFERLPGGHYQAQTRAHSRPYNFLPDRLANQLVVLTTRDCDPQNAIIQITVFGVPTGGTFDWILTVGDTTDTLTFNFDSTNAQFATELATHTNITASDVTVTGGDFPGATMQVEFIDALANTAISLGLPDSTSLTGGTGVQVILSFAQIGFP